MLFNNPYGAHVAPIDVASIFSSFCHRTGYRLNKFVNTICKTYTFLFLIDTIPSNTKK